MIPEKVGLKAIQRNDVDYEYTVVFDVDIAHNSKVSKDRTGMFVGMTEFKINEETGTLIREWCSQESGNRIKENIEVEIEECASLEALRHVYSKYPELQKKILPSIMLKKSELESLGKSINNT